MSDNNSKSDVAIQNKIDLMKNIMKIYYITFERELTEEEFSFIKDKMKDIAGNILSNRIYYKNGENHVYRFITNNQIFNPFVKVSNFLSEENVYIGKSLISLTIKNMNLRIFCITAINSQKKTKNWKEFKEDVKSDIYRIYGGHVVKIFILREGDNYHFTVVTDPTTEMKSIENDIPFIFARHIDLPHYPLTFA